MRSDTGVSLVAGQLLCGTAIMAVVTALFTAAPSHVGPGPLLSAGALGVLGTGLAYLLNYAVVRRAGATATAADLQTFLGDHFAKWQLPERWAFIDEVPKTSVGKFDKKVLRARHEQGELTVEHVG